MTVSSTEWMAQGSCVTQGIDPDIFFPVDSRGVAIAKLYCQDCPVRLECLSYALQADERFGGTRTWHKLLGALTAADLVIHATVGWIYSSGFIKSLDATRAICERTGTSAPPEWRGWGTALKPAWEPIVVASMPGGTPPALPPVIYTGKAPPQERPQVNGIAHPTVKPLTLIRQLVQVTTPRDGLVLDPFLGSGTLAEAAIAEGRRFVGCEDHAGYLPLIQHRISRAEQGLIPGTHRWERARRAAEERRLIATSGQLDLFSAL